MSHKSRTPEPGGRPSEPDRTYPGIDALLDGAAFTDAVAEQQQRVVAFHRQQLHDLEHGLVPRGTTNAFGQPLEEPLLVRRFHDCAENEAERELATGGLVSAAPGTRWVTDETPDCAFLPMPELPAAVFEQDAFMRGLGYQRTRFELNVEASKIESGYTRDKPLTWQEVYQAMERLTSRRLPEPVPLVLPGWFPTELRPIAECWAREHRWDGVVYDEVASPIMIGEFSG